MGIGPPPPIPSGGEGGSIRRVEQTADRRQSAREEARQQGDGGRPDDTVPEDTVEVSDAALEGEAEPRRGENEEPERKEAGRQDSPPSLDIEA